MDIRRRQLTADSDWVVKVDADAVFLPVRLLHTLHDFKVPEGGVYIENCHKVKFGFFGNLEVVSQDGFSSFLANLGACKADRPKELQKVKNLKWQPNCLDINAVSYHP